jgi:hypothetical protein
MKTVKIGKWGSFSLAYLKKVSKAKFWKDFSHLTEDQRNEAWEATHDNKRVPKQVEDVQPADGD